MSCRLWAYFEQLVLSESGRAVVEVQHGGGRLDDVPAAVRAAEAVVSGQTEILIAAAAVGQLKHLAGNHSLLLGHAEEDKATKAFKKHRKWAFIHVWASPTNTGKINHK